ITLTADRGTLSTSARYEVSSSFARPSTGGAASAILSVVSEPSPAAPMTRVRLARGLTRTAIDTPSRVSCPAAPHFTPLLLARQTVLSLCAQAWTLPRWRSRNPPTSPSITPQAPDSDAVRQIHCATHAVVESNAA